MEGDKVTIELDSFDEMRAKAADHLREVSALQKELHETRMKLAAASTGDADGTLFFKLVAAVRSAKDVASFAIGNLHHDTVRGWPHQALDNLARTMLEIPNVDQQEREWANDTIHFARTAKATEVARAHGVHQALAGIPLSATSSPVGAAKLEGAVTQLVQNAAEQQKAMETD